MTKEVVNISSPSELETFAKELKKFIVTQGLYTNIQGKNYVNVEGWEFAGASTGILPVMQDLVNESTDKEIKYRATVDLVRVKDGSVVGRGFAVCSNRESKRSNADEYVISSMAQTRAIGKAYRNLFGFLMKMAGYEPTPTEDMVADAQSGNSADPDVYDQIQAVKTKADFAKLLRTLDANQLKDYVDELEAKKKEVYATA